MKTSYRWVRSTRPRYTNQLSYGYYNPLLQRRRNDLGILYGNSFETIVFIVFLTLWFISSRIWKILVRPGTYQPYRFWRPCFSANKYMRVSLTFKRHMILYGTMVCFISLVLKSVALSYIPDSEHHIKVCTVWRPIIFQKLQISI